MKLNGQTTVVVGAQLGDEGKAKVVDYLAKTHDIVVRFNGGDNAGHTVVVDGVKHVFHLIPAGALYPDKVNCIGAGVVFNPEMFLREFQYSQQVAGTTYENFKIASNAHVILPNYIDADGANEGTTNGIGSTKRGIGPAYEAKVGRKGIRVGDLLSAKKLTKALSRGAELDSQTFERFLDYGKQIAPMVCDVGAYLETSIKQGKKVLFEGAQGALLDIDHGAYPYVTSSSCVTAAAATGSGIGPNLLNNLVGVIKGYVTKVGKGPFPTQMEQEVDEATRNKGSEWGATTGRPRKCGWLDLVALRYACQINGLNGLWINKCDILASNEKILVCTGYTIDGKTVSNYSLDTEDLESAVPVYQSLSGWDKADMTDANFRAFIAFIESNTGCPVVGIGTGPGRDDVWIP